MLWFHLTPSPVWADPHLSLCCGFTALTLPWENPHLRHPKSPQEHSITLWLWGPLSGPSRLCISTIQQGPAGLGVGRLATSCCSLWSIVLALGVLKRQNLLQSCLKTLRLRNSQFLRRCKTFSCPFSDCSIEQPRLWTGLYPVHTGNKYLLYVTRKVHSSLIVQISQPNPQIKLLLSPKLI